MWKISFPPAVVLSMFSAKLLNPRPTALQGANSLQEVAQVAPETIQTHNDDQVALAGVGDHLVQAGPGGAGTGSHVAEDLLAPGASQLIFLRLGALVRGAHAAVANLSSPRVVSRTQLTIKKWHVDL